MILLRSFLTLLTTTMSHSQWKIMIDITLTQQKFMVRNISRNTPKKFIDNFITTKLPQVNYGYNFEQKGRLLIEEEDIKELFIDESIPHISLKPWPLTPHTHISTKPLVTTQKSKGKSKDTGESPGKKRYFLGGTGTELAIQGQTFYHVQPELVPRHDIIKKHIYVYIYIYIWVLEYCQSVEKETIK